MVQGRVLGFNLAWDQFLVVRVQGSGSGFLVQGSSFNFQEFGLRVGGLMVQGRVLRVPRGGPLFKAYRLLYDSALGLRVIEKKKKDQPGVGSAPCTPPLKFPASLMWDLGFRV